MQKEASKKSSAHLSDTFLRSRTLWAFLLPFVVYVFTAPHSVTFEDSGLFILASYYWGIPHPPGYPVYTILSHIFTLLPFGEVAFRVSLFSVVTGALGGMFCYLIFKRLSQQPVLALLASLIAAFSATIWSQMLVAEVYPLNYFLSLMFMYGCLYIADHPSEKRLFILGIIGALALSNHWPIFVLCGPAYLLLIHRSWLKPKYFAMFILGLSFCVVPYLIMWWRSTQNPEISFLGEIKSFGALINYALRKYYSANDVSPLHSWRDVLLFYREFLLRVAYKDFFVLLLPCFGLGLYKIYKEKLWRILMVFLYLLMATSFILPLLLRLEFNVLDENIFRVFWLIPFFAYSYFVLMGAVWLEERKKFVGMMVLSVGLFANLLFNFEENNLRNDHFAESYARVVLKSIPPNSVLVSSADSDVGPVAYTQMILKENPTLSLYTGTSVFFKNRIYNPLVGNLDKRYQFTENFIKENSPVYSIKNLNIFDGRKELPVESFFDGLTYRYTKYPEEKTKITPDVLAEAQKALTHYVNGMAVNNWIYHRGALAARLCNILVLQGDETHEVFSKSTDCQQVLGRHLAATGRREQADKMFLSWIHNTKWPITREKQQYVYHFLINRLELVNSIKGDPDRQHALIREALPIAELTLFDYPLCDNLVYPVLKSIQSQLRLSPEALDQLQVFDKCKSK